MSRTAGTAGLIGVDAVQRAVSAVRNQRQVSLSRVSSSTTESGSYGHETIAVDVIEGTMEARRLSFRIDHLELESHGLANTHVDALHHIVLDGQSPAYDDIDSVLIWAKTGIVTRGVLLDIPRLRGTRWVMPGDPVTATDLENASREVGVPSVEPGDAILLYMGRDRFEAAGNDYLPGRLVLGDRPGLARSGGEWIRDRQISVLCWDFQDAIDSSQPGMEVHRLIAETGLVLVDNCDLGPASTLAADLKHHECLLMIAPLRIPGLTGSMVNPIAMF